MASFIDFTYSATCSGASVPYFSISLTIAEPTIAPSEMSAILFACSGVEIPNPIAHGTFVFSLTTFTIELGIPFSDPAAEGPVIQGANLRALRGGITTDKIFAFVKELRRDVKVPMVFMTYANVVFSYGAEKFISTCRDIGIDGLILPDLPYEEKEEFLTTFTIDARSVLISLRVPVTPRLETM